MKFKNLHEAIRYSSTSKNHPSETDYYSSEEYKEIYLNFAD